MNFLNALFDFSFTHLITTKIIKVLYGIFMVLAGLAALGAIIAGFSASAEQGILILILSPLIFLLYAIMARVWLELIIVIFRIAEHTAEIAEQGRPTL